MLDKVEVYAISNNKAPLYLFQLVATKRLYRSPLGDDSEFPTPRLLVFVKPSA